MMPIHQFKKDPTIQSAR